MNDIIEILMTRDELSYDDALDLYNQAKAEADEVLLNDGGLDDIENILSDYFGLEPDYIFDLIDI